ncbi:MAG: PDZ domain-containing protein [Vicinamibacteria bacterium]
MSLPSCRPVLFSCLLALVAQAIPGQAQEPSGSDSRLLRQPDANGRQVVFTYGGDLWVAELSGGDARRLTSTGAVESDPHFSPDGQFVAFTSNRSGMPMVYVLPIAGGTPKRLTWYPAASYARGWTPDGTRVLYASSRETAPVGFERLWTVSTLGGPSDQIAAPRGHDGSYSPDGKKMIVDGVSRWDVEWRHYRGGQNTPLTILNLDNLDEVRLPNERTMDIHPVWMGRTVYFLSDRDGVMNVWSYEPEGARLNQLTRFPQTDVKWLSGHGGTLVFEYEGRLHTLDPITSKTKTLAINVLGDFPWAEPRWEDVTKKVTSVSLSPSGKRVLIEARGEIFTVPVEKGDTRNLTRSSGAADRAPVWSPKGDEVAWFSDSGGGYELLIGSQDGLKTLRRLNIGPSKMAWDVAWSPDARRIAFVDDDVRVRIVELSTGKTSTVDVGGTNLERGDMGLTWSHDSKWLAYAKTFPNKLRRVVLWSVDGGPVRPITDAMADAISPTWDRDGKHLYFLASTDTALGSGWANTSSVGSDPTFGVYVVMLSADETSPFAPESDEEAAGADAKEDKAGAGAAKGDKSDKPEASTPKVVDVRIAFEGLERRIVPLPMAVSRYRFAVAGPAGSVFVGERVPPARGATLHKFTLEKRKAEKFTEETADVSVSNDGKKLLFRRDEKVFVVDTAKNPEPGKGEVKLALRTYLDRPAEWRQIFDETWRYERDFFYDPDLHGADWNAVRARYAPLVTYVRHRDDLNYILDQVNGELSVGHSFVRGGDMPEVEKPSGGVLGADLVKDGGRWKIARIYTFESWNPKMLAPLDRAGLKVSKGNYILSVDGVEMTDRDDPYRLLDGTAKRQTVLQVNDKPSMTGSWSVIVEPSDSESALRQRAWVEDNRRKVDELSGGKLAYVWVPNTGGEGVVSFNRYFFAQQDKLGAVIDERFNGGGLLDDYMVDLMTRRPRAALTNEVPDGKPFVLPAGILGPKVLLINERAGSGGDFFPWVFRQQNAGPLIGARTWGGLVKSSVHYPLVDGGTVTAPDNAVFDPIKREWVAENKGIPPDIEVLIDAKSAAAGRDTQLERGVTEALRLLAEKPPVNVVAPPFSKPARPSHP